MRIIDTDIKNVDKIFHIADIHIRNYKRHKEYRGVFKNLEEVISKEKTKNSIIYVAGDIVHNKTDISPELIVLVSEFFSMLAGLCPTFVILGNHDMNLKSPNRIDALSPILNVMDNPNIHFLDEHGFYKFAQLGFNVLEVSRDPSEILDPKELDTPVKIACYHGVVHNSETATGYKLENAQINIGLFDGHHLCLLGDIHKRQFMQALQEEPELKPHVCYPSSLIQQDHGESLDKHGMVVWDLKKMSYKEVDIPNKFAYYTVEVEDGEIQNWDEDLPDSPRIRIRYTNTDVTKRKEVEAIIKAKRNVAELTTIVNNRLSSNEPNSISKIIGNVRQVEYQNNLIADFLADHSVPDSLMDSIYKINKEMNTRLPEEDLARNVVWKPLYFEYSNMFSYGEGNFINFQDFEGLYGIFAPNTAGKSTLLDSLCFCLFDKCSKTNRGKDVLNKESKEFKCYLEFDVNGKKYFVERHGYKNGKSVKVDVDFYTMEGGTKISLNGDKRSSTNKIIRSYVGTYEDFILTALSIQNGGTNFIDKTQKERRDLLSQFLDIKIFDSLYDMASVDIKETKVLVESLKKEDFSDKLKTHLDTINELQEEYSGVEKVIEDTKGVKDKFSEKREDLIKSITSIEDLPSEQSVKSKIDYLKKEKNSLVESLPKLDPSEDQIKLEQATESYNALPPIEQLKDEVDKMNRLKDSGREKLSERNQLRQDKIRYEQDIKHMESHEYDPDCEYCIKNPVVDRGERAKIALEKTLNRIEDCTKELQEIADRVRELEVAEKSLEDKKRLDMSIKYINNNISLLIEKKKTVLQEIENKDTHIEIQEELLGKVQNIENIRIENEEINNKIKVCDQQILTLRGQIETNQSKLISLTRSIAHSEAAVNNCEEKLNTLAELNDEYEAYTFYMKAVKNSGVPYKLIKTTLPQIEDEINNILSPLVEFYVSLEAEGTDNINAYINYEDVKWPLETTSGMEKFISSLAVRSALIGSTALPKPNFIAIDEGFGVLDADNLANIAILFQIFKEDFEFVLCISHLQSMKDVVDKRIEISKDDGFSNVTYGSKKEIQELEYASIE